MQGRVRLVRSVEDRGRDQGVKPGLSDGSSDWFIVLVKRFWGGAECRGGCDSCDRRKAGEVSTRDLAQPVGLLLAAVAAMRAIYGIGKPIMLLRGSKGKDMASWLEVDPDHTKCLPTYWSS